MVVMAVVTSLVIWPLYQKINVLLPKPHWLSPLLSIFISIVFVMIPLALIISFAVSQLVTQVATLEPALVATQLTVLVDDVNRLLATFPFLSFRVTPEVITNTVLGYIQPAVDILVNSAFTISSNSISFIAQSVIFLILLQYLLPQLPKLHRLLLDISPFNSEVTEQYFIRSRAMIFDTLKGSVVIATTQAVIAFILFVFLGIPVPLVLTFLLWLVALLPVFGAALVTIPMSIVLLLTGNWMAALVIFLVQILIFANIDNVLRPKLVSKEADLNPALMLLAVVGGLKVFGVMGIIYGPLVLVILVVSLDIYRHEYR